MSVSFAAVPQPAVTTQNGIEALVQAHEHLVQRTVSVFFSRGSVVPGLERDDLLQEARLGLLYAARNYQSERSDFATFAIRCIRSKLCDVVTSRRRPVPDQLTAEAAASLVDGATNDVDLHVALSQALAELPERQAYIIRRVYLEGYQQVDVAQELGISKVHVGRLLRAALESLREQLGGDFLS